MICHLVFAASPTISSFSPASGPIGTLVTINGTNLNAPSAVTIGGHRAIVISNAGNVLVAMVMPGSVTGLNQPQLINDGLLVHQALSPNGDGINDFLTIENIDN